MISIAYHLSPTPQNSIPECKLLAAVFSEFAAKYPNIKCLKIVGDQCIENYPDKNMPTILVYGPKDTRHQFVGLSMLGGSRTRVKGK